MPPPVDAKEFGKTQESLTELRDALKLKGIMETTEAKAKFTRDENLVKSDEYTETKEKFEALDKEL